MAGKKTAKKPKVEPVAGFKPLGGKSRNYKNVKTGKVISRRQFDKIKKAKGIYRPKNITQLKHQRAKQGVYNALLRDYIEKQKQKGKIISRKKARESKTMKGIVQDLKSPFNAIKLRALKKTVRRDGIDDSVPVGESPKAGQADE
jgi:hypothetical protein